MSFLKQYFKKERNYNFMGNKYKIKSGFHSRTNPNRYDNLKEKQLSNHIRRLTREKNPSNKSQELDLLLLLDYLNSLESTKISRKIIRQVLRDYENYKKTLKLSPFLKKIISNFKIEIDQERNKFLKNFNDGIKSQKTSMNRSRVLMERNERVKQIGNNASYIQFAKQFPIAPNTSGKLTGGSKKIKKTIGKDGKVYYFKNGKRIKNPNKRIKKKRNNKI